MDASGRMWEGDSVWLAAEEVGLITDVLGEVAEKSYPARAGTSAAEAGLKLSGYRSGKPLRHPRASAKPTFSAGCKAAMSWGANGTAEAVP